MLNTFQCISHCRHSREPGWQEPGRVFVPAGAGAELLQPADIKLEDEISLEEADDWPSCSEGAKDHSGQSALDENSSHAPHLSPQHGEQAKWWFM